MSTPTKAQTEAAIIAKFARRILKEYHNKLTLWDAKVRAIERRIAMSETSIIQQHAIKAPNVEQCLNGYSWRDDTGQMWLLTFETCRELAEREAGIPPHLEHMLDFYGRVK